MIITELLALSIGEHTIELFKIDFKGFLAKIMDKSSQF